jgi:aerobic carbon-monoxide dehydrogenase small subunit
MEISLWINEELIKDDVPPDTLLLDYVRSKGCYSVKRGCETANCGLCTVLLEEKPVLSCSILVARANGKRVTTLEGLQKEAQEFGAFLADQGGDQCGYCNPGFVINVIAMTKELNNPTMLEIKEYLVGNLCRCTGYQGQLRGILEYLKMKREAK